LVGVVVVDILKNIDLVRSRMNDQRGWEVRP